MIDAIIWSKTIAGAIAPIISGLLFIPVRLLLRRVESNRDHMLARTHELEVKLGEAEGAIRGDIANGVKQRLVQIEEKLPDPPAEQP